MSGEQAPKGCIFCELPAQGSDRQRENLILSCGARALVMLNKYPYNNGHLLIVPRAHVADPSQLDEPDYRALGELLRRAIAAVTQVMRPEGVNVGMNLGRPAGAGIVDHCHYHVVPRWAGDTNFMPAIGETRVISVGLEESYDQLRPAMADLAPQVEEEIG